MNKKHHEETIKSGDILKRLDELEKEEAKIVYMKDFIERKIESIQIGTMQPTISETEMWKIIYKK